MRLKDLYACLAIIGVSTLAMGGVSYAIGIRINTTKSIPVGFYQTSNAPIEKSAYVMFCPPPTGLFDKAMERGYIGAGYCPGGYGFMMKKILAAKKETVTINGDGVYINGQLVPQSHPFKADAAGRPLPSFQIDNHTLDDSELLLMSDVSSTSFDGRYFGLISRTQVTTVIRPLYTW